MVMTPEQVVDAAKGMESRQAADNLRLDVVAAYLRGAHSSVYVPAQARQEYRWLVTRARVNVLPLVVDTIAQNLYVDGYRPARTAENAPAWAIWQANRMDARQTGLHRAALSYGVAFLVGLPGDPVPMMVPRSPRRLTAVFADPVDDEWPLMALEKRESGWRVYEPFVYHDLAAGEGGRLEWVATHEHGFAHCPVVRYANRVDLDGAVVGEVEPLIPLQDQVNQTTFGLLMAQTYSAFRQRWATGMAIPEDENGNPVEPFNIAVNRLIVGEDPDTKFGEFGQTDLGGYIDSRESTLRHLATVSQVPPHALLGQMANLSAEALIAANQQQDMKIAERKVLFGEAHEQALRMVSTLAGDADAGGDVAAQVVWRDTQARSMSATVDALGKLAQMLGVPPSELWDRVPGVTTQDVERWKAAAADAGSLGDFAAMLERQTAALMSAEEGVQ